MRTELIYGAATDDALFAELPSLLAAELGARSAVLHWQGSGAGFGELADTGYFSAEQMMSYDAGFSGADLWSDALNGANAVNRMWQLDALVPPSTYERSRIFNEWIRPMGDDTFHAAGAVLIDGWGRAELGFHRGRSEGGFSADRLRALDADLVHIREMLKIRARLLATKQDAGLTSSALDMLAMGVVSVAASGTVTYANAAAERLLAAGSLRLVGKRLATDYHQDQARLDAAVAAAQRPHQPQAGAVSVRDAAGFRYLLSIAPLAIEGVERQAVIFFAEAGPDEGASLAALRDLFGLTRSEAYLAARLAEGASLQEIAASKGVTLGTLRTQLKAISQKLGCHRQAGIVSLVKGVPSLRRPRED